MAEIANVLIAAQTNKDAVCIATQEATLIPNMGLYTTNMLRHLQSENA
jgi:hypothetical protein